MNAEHRPPPGDWLAHAQFNAGATKGCVYGCLISSVLWLIIGWLIYAVSHLPGW